MTSLFPYARVKSATTPAHLRRCAKFISRQFLLRYHNSLPRRPGSRRCDQPPATPSGVLLQQKKWERAAPFRKSPSFIKSLTPYWHWANRQHHRSLQQQEDTMKPTVLLVAAAPALLIAAPVPADAQSMVVGVGAKR